MKKVGIIGNGRIGSYMAKKLVEMGYEVLVADVNVDPHSDGHIHYYHMDACQFVSSDFNGCDVIITAVPGAIGAKVLANVIEYTHGYVPIVDISFMPEDPRDLEIWEKHDITVVADCGVAPGLCGMIAGYEATQFDEPLSCEIMVGGLPVLGGYKVPFSPADVLEEYMRPARYVVLGEIQTKPALDIVSPYTIDGKPGAAEAILTDGLRTLLDLPFPSIREWTLRWAGHAEQMRILRDMQLFGSDHIDQTRQILERAWTPEGDEQEFTRLEVEAYGTIFDKIENHKYTLNVDGYYNSDKGPPSMAVSTGAPAIVVATMLMDGFIEKNKGLVLPEHIGADQKQWREFRKRLYGHFGIQLIREVSRC